MNLYLFLFSQVTVNQIMESTDNFLASLLEPTVADLAVPVLVRSGSVPKIIGRHL